MARKPTDEVQLKLRFPETLRRKLERAADREGRSMNTEIIRRLERTFAVDASAEGTNVLDYLGALGIDVSKANEADVATALGQLFGRWARWAPLRPPDKDDGARDQEFASRLERIDKLQSKLMMTSEWMQKEVSMILGMLSRMVRAMPSPPTDEGEKQ